jgi:hypothetical protein
MFQFTIRRADAEDDAGVLVIADSRDVLVWERAARNGEARSVTQLLASPSMSASYSLAYVAAKRQEVIPAGLSPREFDRDYVLMFGAQSAPDPTQPAR